MDELTLTELMEKYEAMHVELTPLINEMNATKKAIVQRVLDDNLPDAEHGRIKATRRNGYTRQSWDGKALNGYAAAHPEILTFRKESQVRPTVAVKVL